MLSPCLLRGRLFCRLAVRRQRLFELLFDTEGVGGCARPEFPQRVPIALAPSDQSLMVFSALADEGDDAVGELGHRGGLRLRLPPARRNIFGGDGNGLEARFREDERAFGVRRVLRPIC